MSSHRRPLEARKCVELPLTWTGEGKVSLVFKVKIIKLNPQNLTANAGIFVHLRSSQCVCYYSLPVKRHPCDKSSSEPVAMKQPRRMRTDLSTCPAGVSGSQSGDEESCVKYS